jgi:hypothetical protein
MPVFFIALALLFLTGLPALLIISACMSASRATRNEETLYS